MKVQKVTRELDCPGCNGSGTVMVKLDGMWGADWCDCCGGVGVEFETVEVDVECPRCGELGCPYSGTACEEADVDEYLESRGLECDP